MTPQIPTSAHDVTPFAYTSCGDVSNEAWIMAILRGDGVTPVTVDDIIDEFCDNPRMWLEVSDLYLLGGSLPPDMFARVLRFVLFADLTEYDYLNAMIADLWSLERPDEGPLSSAAWAVIMGAAGYTVDAEDAPRPTDEMVLARTSGDPGWAWTAHSDAYSHIDPRSAYEVVIVDPDRLLACSVEGDLVRYFIDVTGLALLEVEGVSVSG